MLKEIVPAGAPWCGIVPRGRILRITDLHGRQAVDFLCYNALEPEERYHVYCTRLFGQGVGVTRRA